jgi:hypothetical protein
MKLVQKVLLIVIEVQAFVVVARLVLNIWTGERTQMRAIVLVA